ncbi:MAG: AI-2E family transporter [Clostridiales bacterium]|nr:AI-2E family transporter [Clostridiales bacterium]
MKLDWKTCFKIGCSVFLLYLAIHYWSAVSILLGTLVHAAEPLIIGCIIAYLINILMSSYEKRYFPGSSKPSVQKSRRPVCMLAAVVTLLAVLGLVVWLIAPQLVECFKIIFAALPGAIETAVDWLDKFHLLPENIVDTLEAIDWRSRLDQILDVITSSIGSVVDVVVSTLTGLFSGIVTAFISVIFAFYLLVSKDRIAGQLDRIQIRYLKKTWYDKIRYGLCVFNDCFRRYIVGQCLEALILGTLCMVGMMILRLPYAAMVGSLVAVTALIPIAGAYIGAAVGAFMILTVSPMKALIFLIFLVILQQIEGNLIYPKVVGTSLGLPGIWVLAAVTIGGGILGIPGMLLGVPIAAAVYRLLRADVKKPPRDPAFLEH